MLKKRLFYAQIFIVLLAFVVGLILLIREDVLFIPNATGFGMFLLVMLTIFTVQIVFRLREDTPDEYRNWLISFFDGVSTELVGAILSGLIFVVLVGSLERIEKREKLILQLGSRVQVIAVNAAIDLRLEGWLEDGSLRDANLLGANLAGADLVDADLQGVDLSRANLTEVDLLFADVQEASFAFADLQDAAFVQANVQDVEFINANAQDALFFQADLMRADFANARLERADFMEADLTGAVLANANLTDAEMMGAILDDVTFNESTMLPDGTNWTSETDMTRFTDLMHPDFWRSGNPESPTFMGG